VVAAKRIGPETLIIGSEPYFPYVYFICLCGLRRDIRNLLFDRPQLFLRTACGDLRYFEQACFDIR
jgi:hypothetical protein